MDPASSFGAILDALGYQIRQRVLIELMDHNPVDHRETIVEGAAYYARQIGSQLVRTQLPTFADMDLV